MEAYQYTGRDGRGAVIRGTVEAEDDVHARASLREQGLFITSLSAQRRAPLASWFRHGPGLTEVAAFTFHLAGLVSSGVPLLRGLEVLRDQTESGSMSVAIAELEASVRAGQSLSAALAAHPEIFSPLYIGIVRTGEVSGGLDQALLRLTDYLDREVTLTEKLRTMMVYPIFVLVLAAVVVALFTAFVVPAFDRVYQSVGATLPLPTLVLVSISRLARRFWPVVLIGVAVGIWGLTRPRVSHALRDAAGGLIRHIPRLRNVAQTVQVNRFIRTFSAMYASGVPVLSALDVTNDAVTDPRMRSATGHLKQSISRGRRLSDAMRAVGLFPPMIHRMVAMGEESGQLDAMLRRASDLLDREIDYAIKRLVTLAEPILTLALGAVVAGILLALYLPIFGLARVLLR
jgi:type II secretory pathway component PulF